MDIQGRRVSRLRKRELPRERGIRQPVAGAPLRQFGNIFVGLRHPAQPGRACLHPEHGVTALAAPGRSELHRRERQVTDSDGRPCRRRFVLVLSLPVLFLLDSITPIVGSGGSDLGQLHIHSDRYGRQVADRRLLRRPAQEPLALHGPIVNPTEEREGRAASPALSVPLSRTEDPSAATAHCLSPARRQQVGQGRRQPASPGHSTEKAPVLCALTPSRRAKGGETFLRSAARAYPPPPARCRARKTHPVRR